MTVLADRQTDKQTNTQWKWNTWIRNTWERSCDVAPPIRKFTSTFIDQITSSIIQKNILVLISLSLSLFISPNFYLFNFFCLVIFISINSSSGNTKSVLEFIQYRRTEIETEKNMKISMHSEKKKQTIPTNMYVHWAYQLSCMQNKKLHL